MQLNLFSMEWFGEKGPEKSVGKKQNQHRNWRSLASNTWPVWHLTPWVVGAAAIKVCQVKLLIPCRRIIWWVAKA